MTFDTDGGELRAGVVVTNDEDGIGSCRPRRREADHEDAETRQEQAALLSRLSTR